MIDSEYVWEKCTVEMKLNSLCYYFMYIYCEHDKSLEGQRLLMMLLMGLMFSLLSHMRDWHSRDEQFRNLKLVQIRLL